MANQYTFCERGNYKTENVLNSAVLVEDGIVWEQDGEQVSLSYANDSDETLTESHPTSFLSANDSTQDTYFSVLETTNETMLGSLSDVIVNNEAEVTENLGQPEIYRIEDSDELYAFESACDDEGNVQRFRYRLRLNESGEYEAVPDSIELLPLEESEPSAQETPLKEQEEEIYLPNQKVFVKQEDNVKVVEDHEMEDEREPSLDYEQEEREEETKAGILEQHLISFKKSNGNVKSEISEEIFGISDASIPQHFTTDAIETETAESQNENEQSTTESSFVHQSEDSNGEDGTSSEFDNEENTYLDEANEESEGEDYQIVDGVHITADTDSNDATAQILEHSFKRDESQQQILKIQQQVPVLQVTTNDKVNSGINKAMRNYTYFIVKHPEKENVAVLASNTNAKLKVNPRSILKSSYLHLDQRKEEKPKEKKTLKKGSLQSKCLHNFINRTTIVQAPIRQQRLPRKQTIKPVKRADEEIIVQEVVVSSSGFIETSQDGVVTSKVPLKATEFVQLSDSDDDYDPKKENHRKKKHKKRRSKGAEIIISDSEDTLDVVQIDSDEDSFKNTPIKRKRGRPPKRKTEDPEESSPKKQKSGDTESVPSRRSSSCREEEMQNIKTKWKCTKCPKAFPSQGSLKSHMQYHNFHEPKTVDSTLNKYECAECGGTFKNSVLLLRHAKLHQEAKVVCNICHKPLANMSQLANHRRTHVKEQMFKTTTLPKDLPKAKTPPNHKSARKTNFKCEQCSKIFSNNTLLEAHTRIHKRFKCTSCNERFISKLTLEDHIHNSCVKKRRTHVNRSSSLSASPRRLSQRLSNKSNKLFPWTKKLKCDLCPATFNTFAGRHSHKVIKHGIDAPDKDAILSAEKEPMWKKKLRRKLEPHGGVPPSSDKLRKAYVNLITKLYDTFEEC